MRKLILIFLGLMLAFTEVKAQYVKSNAVLTFTTKAELDASWATPPEASYGSELAFTNDTQTLWKWDGTSAWEKVANWADLSGIPAAFSDGTDDVDDADADPTNELQSWGTLPGIPAAFSDGTDDVDDADASATNEGALSVTSGVSTSSVIHSNTSGSTDVTINATAPLTISETSSSITLGVSAASTSASGVSELATAAETEAGSSTTLTVTPSGLENLIPKLSASAISGSTLTLDCGNDYSHIFKISNSGNTNCTLTINNEQATAGVYVFHFYGFSALTDIIFPTDYKKADGSTNLGTLKISDNAFVTCYGDGTNFICSQVIDQ